MVNREIPYIDLFVEWRKRFREARIRLDARRRELDEELAVLSAEESRLEAEENLIVQAETIYTARMENGIHDTRIAGGNLREVLIINFASPVGVIRGREASAALIDIGYFSNRQSADGAVYNILSKPPFAKFAKGVYIISTKSSEWLRLRGPSDGTFDEVPGTDEATNNPQAPQNGSPRGRGESIYAKQIDAIVRLAESHDGSVRSGQAASTLKIQGLFTNPKWIGFNAMKVLQKSKRFVKVDRGVYHLTS